MSDRIDELVAEAEFLNDNGCDKCEIVTQLAAIAREAEARAAEWIDRCYQSEERALKAEAMCKWLAVAMGRHDTVNNVLDAARQAVIRGAKS